MEGNLRCTDHCKFSRIFCGMLLKLCTHVLSCTIALIFRTGTINWEVIIFTLVWESVSVLSYGCTTVPSKMRKEKCDEHQGIFVVCDSCWKQQICLDTEFFWRTEACIDVRTNTGWSNSELQLLWGGESATAQLTTPCNFNSNPIFYPSLK